MPSGTLLEYFENGWWCRCWSCRCGQRWWCPRCLRGCGAATATLSSIRYSSIITPGTGTYVKNIFFEWYRMLFKRFDSFHLFMAVFLSYIRIRVTYLLCQRDPLSDPCFNKNICKEIVKFLVSKQLVLSFRRRREFKIACFTLFFKYLDPCYELGFGSKTVLVRTIYFLLLFFLASTGTVPVGSEMSNLKLFSF